MYNQYFRKGAAAEQRLPGESGAAVAGFEPTTKVRGLVTNTAWPTQPQMIVTMLSCTQSLLAEELRDLNHSPQSLLSSIRTTVSQNQSSCYLYMKSIICFTCSNGMGRKMSSEQFTSHMWDGWALCNFESMWMKHVQLELIQMGFGILLNSSNQCVVPSGVRRSQIPGTMSNSRHPAKTVARPVSHASNRSQCQSGLVWFHGVPRLQCTILLFLACWAYNSTTEWFYIYRSACITFTSISTDLFHEGHSS